ncbi:MAG: diguanylate cyclase [Deltaproteobacteria bacterium]|nr:diguanylate cyclase [Deltaproteobacteria bacterium]
MAAFEIDQRSIRFRRAETELRYREATFARDRRVGARILVLTATIVLIYVILDVSLESADPERARMRATLRAALAVVDGGFAFAIARTARVQRADTLLQWAMLLTCGLALGTWSLDVERLAAVSFAFTWINFGILSFVPGPWAARWKAAAAFSVGFVGVLCGHGLPAANVLPVLPLVGGSWVVGAYFGRDLERMRRNAWAESERMAELLDATPTPTLLLDDAPGWPLDRCNEAAARRLGLDATAATGHPLPLVIRDAAANAELERRLGAAASAGGFGQAVVALEVELALPTGGTFWGLLHARRVTIGGPRILLTILDVTERRRAEQELRQRATTDPLTGLHNRDAFFERAAYAVDHPGAGQLWVLMLDVDRFKSINDSYGHAAGDDVLRHVATAMRAEVPEALSVARLGGEEFAVLFEVDGERTARDVGLRVQRAIGRMDVDVGIARARITASAGLSQVNREPEAGGGRLAPPIEAALARADAALYASKGAGRDQVHILRSTHHGLLPEKLDLVGPS